MREAIRLHVKQIADSPAFRGSGRSREFLLKIVERALAGQFDQLKERVLGIELFGRDASYDTGDDAVVRVTASDVRRRLLRYYSEFGPNSELHLEVPVGSYIPEFRRIIEPAKAAAHAIVPDPALGHVAVPAPASPPRSRALL